MPIASVANFQGRRYSVEHDNLSKASIHLVGFNSWSENDAGYIANGSVYLILATQA